MKRELLSAIALLLTFTCFSQTGYIEYNDNCMDRYVYQLQDSKNNETFISYRIQMGANQYVMLEVDEKTKKYSQGKPAGTRACETWIINRKTVQDINDGKRKMAVVRKDRNGYYTMQVKEASFYYMVGPALEYTSDDAIFSVNLEKPVYSKNLAMEGSKKQVYLDGVDFEQCKKGFILRKTTNLKDKTYKEFTFSPEIGVLEKRSVILAKGNTRVNVIRLQSIDGKQLDEVINLSCSKNQAESYDKPIAAPKSVVTSYNADSYNARVNTKPTFSARGTTSAPPCPNVSHEGWHIVKTGETLYSISRRYGISLAQLRNWNAMQNSNTISPCQELKVTATASKSSRVVTRPQPTVVTTPPPVTRNDVRTTTTTDNNSTGYTGYRPTTTTATRPRPTYDNTYATGGTPAWITAGNYHTVMNGENIASIAQMYGFTEGRFRYMNGMGEREQVYAGQVLRVTICEENKAVSNVGQPHPYQNTTGAVTSYSYENTTPIYSNYNETYLAPRAGGVDYRVHIVQDGESLFSIAKDYGTSVERIRSINNMTPGEVIIQSQRVYIDK
jgi:LysM repeat protein